jgi:hypothetical protein
MPATVCNASFSTTCPRKPNSIQNGSVLTNFLSGILNSQPNYKQRKFQVICKMLSACSWLLFNFLKKFFFCNLNAIFSLAAKIALIHFETPEIAKMLHNVYKGSCIGKYSLRILQASVYFEAPKKIAAWLLERQLPSNPTQPGKQ